MQTLTYVKVDFTFPETEKSLFHFHSQKGLGEGGAQTAFLTLFTARAIPSTGTFALVRLDALTVVRAALLAKC